jgi:glycosyltransferase involved in cell wall biosynthesis
MEPGLGRVADTSEEARPGGSPVPRRPVKVAYLMSRFPKLTETFVLYEILAVRRQGVRADVYPLIRERTRVMHPEARRIVEEARFEPLISWRLLRAHAHYLYRSPARYLGALGRLLRSTLGSRRYFLGALGLFPKAVCFARRMEEEGVTHVHAHFASHPAAAAFVIHRLTDIPYSFTAHGSDLHRDRHMLREKVAEAEFVVPISRFNRNIILADCGSEHAAKTVVIHCGIDPEFFHPPRHEEAPQENTRMRILCTGTLHEVKGQTHLVEACRLLAQRGVPFRCELLGDGPDRSALERQIASAGLTGSVELLGRCTREGVAKRLREVDVFVGPSVPSRDGRREGIPVALMEAAASGLPVVASDLSGIPEAITDGEHGYLIPPGDSVGLADALQRLAADRELRLRMGRAGRERMLREFDLYENARILAQRFISGVNQ